VVHGLLYFADHVARGDEPNYKLLWTMVRYIGEFPQRLHHPKEETFIFDRLAERTQAADTIIGELRVQHEDDLILIRTIRDALGDMEGGAEGAAQRFDDAVRKFADLTWRHMSMEENVLLPLAREHLNQQDWDEISAAFLANGDVDYGAQATRHFKAMFDQIVNLAPAPIGLA